MTRMNIITISLRADDVLQLRRCCLLVCCFPGLAWADPEIMVHEGDLADRGELVATLHANTTLKGREVGRRGCGRCIG
jgi:3',5'-cyclic AMP phosphodiesterase CpdA